MGGRTDGEKDRQTNRQCVGELSRTDGKPRTVDRVVNAAGLTPVCGDEKGRSDTMGWGKECCSAW